MTAPFTIEVDAREVLGFFKSLGQDAPKAIAIALNRTAEDASAIIRANVKKHFTIRTLPLNFVAPEILPARYRATATRLVALLEPYGVGQILDPFEAGTPHRQTQLIPGSTQAVRKVAMPSMGPGGLRATKQTIIPRSLYPVNLGLSIRRGSKNKSLMYNSGKGSERRGIAMGPPIQGKQGTWLMPGKKPGVMVIWQRQDSRTARPLWFLLDQVKRPPDLHFYAGAQAAVDTRWAINMDGAFDAVQRRAAARG